MKKPLAALGVALFLLIAYLAFSPPRYPGIQVPRAMIPPAVLVSITQSNAPPRAFPGVGGVLIILSDGSLWQWGQIGPGNWPRAAVPVQVGTNQDWIQAVAANNHCIGLRKGGTLWEWGWRGDSGAIKVPLRDVLGLVRRLERVVRRAVKGVPPTG